MKSWIKPTVIILSNSIKSGDMPNGVEGYITCSGFTNSDIGGGANSIPPSFCASIDPINGFYDCAGIYQTPNGYIPVFASASELIPGTVCS